MNSITVLDQEIANIGHILTSVPFSSKATTPTPFLNIYKLQHLQLAQLNEESAKFPIDSGKLLKLGISLGNVIKTLQIDEQLYEQQHQQQKSFITNLNSLNNGKTTTKTNGEPSPFVDTEPKRIINGIPSPQPVYHTKFIRNLQSVLKNFDIGVSSSKHVSTTSLQDMPTSHSTATLDQFSDPSHTVNSSPIKLNSKQLLIEKLEINIRLDSLFIYKIVLKLVLQILTILRENLKGQNMQDTSMSISRTSSHSEFEENSSIFSTASLSSGDSIVAMTLDEYLKVTKHVLTRIQWGLIKPFVKMILTEVVESLIHKDFGKLLSTI